MRRVTVSAYDKLRWIPQGQRALLHIYIYIEGSLKGVSKGHYKGSIIGFYSRVLKDYQCYFGGSLL